MKQIYRVYARLGVDLQTNVDNTFLLTRMQFWRFVLDCHLHNYGVTTMEYDRLIGKRKSLESLKIDSIVLFFVFLFSDECLPTENLHAPDQSILVREFLNAIAIISFHLYRLKKM